MGVLKCLDHLAKALKSAVLGTKICSQSGSTWLIVRISCMGNIYTFWRPPRMSVTKHQLLTSLQAYLPYYSNQLSKAFLGDCEKCWSNKIICCWQAKAGRFFTVFLPTPTMGV